jgi:ribosomal protein S18 acetylase RimI-like enzyme
LKKKNIFNKSSGNFKKPGISFMETVLKTTNWVDTVQIRQLRKEDLPSLEWDGEYVRYRDVYLTEFERSQIGSSILWVADKPGVGIIGQVFIQLNAERHELANGISRAYMYAFRIRPTYRSAGLGTKMIQIIENDLVNRKFCWLTLNVAKVNYSARRLYSRLGYKVVANEAGRWSYRDNQGVLQRVVEPAWRMEKFISRVS